MAKRKITVTVDEGLVDSVRQLGDENLSAVVNTALADHVERLARLASLRQLLDRWEADAGPISAAAEADAATAFDQFDEDASSAP
ncbi:MAG: type II toxin-antitoxin system CcdA family antitoxin [Acidimicrobiales bacterium]